jgi:hypothetical protein
MTKRLNAATALAIAAALCVACGGRPDSWDTKPRLPLTTQGLTGSVAIVDPSLDRVVMLTASSDRTLFTNPISIGKNVVATRASADESQLFLLARGVQPRRNPDDEQPSLTVVGGETNPSRFARYTLTDPLQGLSVDPAGEWVVVYDAGGIVVNPNELIFVDITDPSYQPYSKTIRSFGGRPQRLTFTSTLTVPNGPPRRFLIVETDQDVTLVDLSKLDAPEVTLILPKTPTGQTGKPAEVAYHDGDAKLGTDANIAIRLANDSNVMLVDLAAPGPDEQSKAFVPTVNVADVGGVPSSIAFVQTDGGLRLAALVPSKVGATLVDPATTVLEDVEFDKPYSHITPITADVSNKPISSDVALLWSESNTGIAFWSLGQTAGTPFRSVDSYDIGISVSDVKNVPGADFAHVKILESTNASEFYVLDLDKRQSFPMLTEEQGFTLSVSPDGERAWALKAGTPKLARIDFSTLHPTSVQVERSVTAIYDIARRDSGRAAIALHVAENVDTVSVGATVLDALDPDTAKSKFYPGLLMGGLE